MDKRMIYLIVKRRSEHAKKKLYKIKKDMSGHL
jgi:hypothetical protein